MTDTLETLLAVDKINIPIRLYAERALFWPKGQTLFITDPHFGKADSFRHAGIPIPTEVLNNDLARLTKVLRSSQASSLIVLGDFFHSRHSQSDSALDSLHNWRNQHPDLEVILVPGNHDAHAGPPPIGLNIHAIEAPFAVGPFVCHHLPQAQPIQEGYTLAGHLHPHVVLHDRDGSSLRLTSFIFSQHQAILPAFGSFTGGSAYAPSINDRVFVIAEGEIIEVQTTRQRSTYTRNRC